MVDDQIRRFLTEADIHPQLGFLMGVPVHSDKQVAWVREWLPEISIKNWPIVSVTWDRTERQFQFTDSQNRVKAGEHLRKHMEIIMAGGDPPFMESA